MQVKSIAECSILLTFIKIPFFIKTIVLSFLSGRLRHVLLYHSHHHHHLVLIKVQVQEHLPHQGNWQAALRADLTLGKTAICIIVAKFYALVKTLKNEIIS